MNYSSPPFFPLIVGRLCALLLFAFSLSTGLAQTTYTYRPSTGTSNAWSDTTGTTWSPSGSYPNAAGSIIRKSTGNTTSSTLLQDVVAGVTIGGILLDDNSANTWTVNAANALTFDNDGVGSGYASIVINSSNAGSRLLMSNGTTVTLADDLLIDNRSYTASSTAGAVQFQSVIAGTGNLTISNVANTINFGHIRLEADNTFTGNVTVAKGITTFNKSTSMGNVANVVTLGTNGGGDATLVSNVTSAVTLANNIVVAAGSGGTLVLGAKSTVTAANTATTTYTGTMTLNGDVTLDSSQLGVTTGSTVVSFTGAIDGPGNLTVTGTNAGTGTIATWLRGNNTFSGETRVVSGTLRLGSFTTPTVSTNTLALQNSTVNLATADLGALVFGTSTTDGIVAATFGGLTGSRNLALQNTKTSPTGVSLSVGNNNADTSYSGGLTGLGSLTKIGAGTLKLTGTNSYAGSTTITAGVLQLGDAGTTGRLPIATAIVNNASLVINRTDAVVQGTDFSSASITGTGSFTQAGSGSTTFNVANGYTGNTYVTSGTLILSGAGAIGQSSTIINNATFDVSGVSGGFTVGAAQTLQGSGTIIGNTTIAGTISPGNSPGVLTVTGDLTLAGITAMGIDGTTRQTDYDGIDVSGVLTYGGALNLTFGAASSGGASYALFQGGTLAGDFSSVALGGIYPATSLLLNAGVWSATTEGLNFQFTPANGTLAVTAVPEPSTYAALAGLAVLGLALWRRRRG